MGLTSAPAPKHGGRRASRLLCVAGALAAGTYLALIASPTPADARARVSIDAMAFLGHAWLFEHGQVAYRDFSAAWGPVPQLLSRLALALGPEEPLDSGPMVYFIFRAAGVAALVAWAFWLPSRRRSWTALPLLAFAVTLQTSSYTVFRVGAGLLALRAAAATLGSAARLSWPRAAAAAVAFLVAALCSVDVFVYATLALGAGTAMLALRGEPGRRALVIGRAAAVGVALLGVLLIAAVGAAVSASRPDAGLLAPVRRIIDRAATFSQVFGLPIAMEGPGILAWAAFAVIGGAAAWRAAGRTADPLRIDISLLAPFALLGIKSAITRADTGHLAFGLTGLLALLAILPTAEVRGRRERSLLLVVLTGAVLFWPARTLFGGLPARESADPVAAWRALAGRATDRRLLPEELLSIAAGRSGPLFVFPSQIGFAAAVRRPLLAPVDQIYGAHTPELQRQVVEALRTAGPELEVIYGLDGLPTWQVDQVQSIARSPVVADYLLREFRPDPDRVLDGGYLLLRRRAVARGLHWRELTFHVRRDEASIEVKLDRPQSCPLIRIGLAWSYPTGSRIGWMGRVRVLGDAGGPPVFQSRLVALAVDRPFVTYLSPLAGGDFAALFGDAALPEAPPIERLLLAPDATGPFGVQPNRVEVRDLACLVRGGSPA